MNASDRSNLKDFDVSLQINDQFTKNIFRSIFHVNSTQRSNDKSQFSKKVPGQTWSTFITSIIPLAIVNLLINSETSMSSLIKLQCLNSCKERRLQTSVLRYRLIHTPILRKPISLEWQFVQNDIYINVYLVSVHILLINQECHFSFHVSTKHWICGITVVVVKTFPENRVETDLGPHGGSHYPNRCLETRMSKRRAPISEFVVCASVVCVPSVIAGRKHLYTQILYY